MIHSDMTFNRQASLISVVQLSRESLLFSDKIIEQTNQLTCVFFKLLSIKFVAEINRNFWKIFRPFLTLGTRAPSCKIIFKNWYALKKSNVKVTFRETFLSHFLQYTIVVSKGQVSLRFSVYIQPFEVSYTEPITPSTWRVRNIEFSKLLITTW